MSDYLKLCTPKKRKRCLEEPMTEAEACLSSSLPSFPLTFTFNAPTSSPPWPMSISEPSSDFSSPTLLRILPRPSSMPDTSIFYRAQCTDAFRKLSIARPDSPHATDASVVMALSELHNPTPGHEPTLLASNPAPPSQNSIVDPKPLEVNNKKSTLFQDYSQHGNLSEIITPFNALDGTTHCRQLSRKRRKQNSEDTRKVVDPERAAQTWQENEITVFDPDDADDDGEGLNGLGFKPTAAIAYARQVKREKQLAAYRKREASDARSKRNERRRALVDPTHTTSPASSHSRKVRFMAA